MKRVMSSIIGFRAKFLVEVNATVLDHKNLDLLQPYLKLGMTQFQSLLEDFFCDYQHCENDGECRLKPLDQLLKYDDVLRIQSGLYETIEQIYEDPEGFRLFSHQFPYIPGESTYNPEAFKIILPPNDVAILYALSINVGVPNKIDLLEFQYDPSSVFNGESLALLGKTMDIMANIVLNIYPNITKIAETLVRCSCQNFFSGSKCETYLCNSDQITNAGNISDT